jgi:hypothetical protein
MEKIMEKKTKLITPKINNRSDESSRKTLPIPALYRNNKCNNKTKVCLDSAYLFFDLIYLRHRPLYHTKGILTP